MYQPGVGPVACPCDCDFPLWWPIYITQVCSGPLACSGQTYVGDEVAATGDFVYIGPPTGLGAFYINPQTENGQVVTYSPVTTMETISEGPPPVVCSIVGPGNFEVVLLKDLAPGAYQIPFHPSTGWTFMFSDVSDYVNDGACQPCNCCWYYWMVGPFTMEEVPQDEGGTIDLEFLTWGPIWGGEGILTLPTSC